MAGKRRQFFACGSVAGWFASEFKVEAVRLAKESKKPLAQTARELGIRPDMLPTGKRQAESRAGLTPGDMFPGNGKLTSQEEEIRQLRHEVEILKQEREFLKTATAYFAKESR